MFFTKPSNWCAVSGLILPLAILLGSVAPAGATAYLTDEATGVSGQNFASAISELEDMNSDGRGEFLLGARTDNINGLDAGAVFYYRSRPSNAHGLQQIWRGVGGEEFGYAVARIGDVNNDGTPDFAVGAPLSNAGGAASGRVCLFWGGSAISSTPDLVITGAAAGDQFGYAISSAGDFNGDGRDDFIVGAPFKNAPGAESGAAYVIYGASGGPSTNLANALMLGGEIAGDHFGHSVTDAGNFLGTANDCVAVGAPDNTADGINAGAAYVFEGATAPTNPNAVFDLKIRNGASAKPFSRYGFAVRGIGRWDGDGYDDLAIGAPYCNESASTAGRVEIVFGGTSPSATGDRYANGQTATDNLGYALARVGDVVGSSNDDLLMGAPGYDGAATDGGRAYLFAGGSSSTNNAGTLDVVVNAPLNPGTAANDQFGFAVSSAGLFDDDGTLDYAVGAPGGNIGTTAAAGFCLIEDSGGSVVGLDLPEWDASWVQAGQVGLRFSLTGAVSYLALSRIQPPSAAQLLWSGNPTQAEEGTLHFDGHTFSYTDQEAPAGEFSYRLEVTTLEGASYIMNALAGPGLPPASQLQVDPAWPNPFNPRVTVRYRAPAGASVTCRVVDVRGRHIATLATSPASGEWQTVTWDGLTASGALAASGSYFLDIASDGQRVVQRVTLAK